VVRYAVRVGDREIVVDTAFRSAAALHEPGDSIAVSISVDSALWLAA
jgi:hypothetical protein